MHPTVN